MLNQSRNTVILVLFSLSSLNGEEPKMPCTTYYQERVAYLLGCCGDMEMSDYPGTPFRASMTDVERATAALGEISAAKRTRCYASGGLAAQTLTLNGVGAHLMRARARATSLNVNDLSLARIDSDVARQELLAFITKYPALAAKNWYWITMSFRRSGHSWDALNFLAGLPRGCCAMAEKEVLIGDLYYSLDLLASAAEHYSLWLKSASQNPGCGHAQSAKNAEELRRRGFVIPLIELGTSEQCVSGEAWGPYTGVIH
jgi:hypothetical protein